MKNFHKKLKRNNNLSIRDIKIPNYDEVKRKIRTKVGEIPKIAKDLQKGRWAEQALRVLKERYLRKDNDGKLIETPEEMCWRVAWDIASAEVLWGKGKSEVRKIAKEFYKLLITHQFLPNSPTLMNAGTNNGLQYSGCFVLPVEDSLVGIFDSLKHQALIHQAGGGTGFSFGKLRPRGSVVKSSKGTASGPVSFMKIFDAATNEIKQGGKRRGANMGILRVDHPDILEFIHCKEDGGVTNFNISVAITNRFMKALENDKEYDLVATRKDYIGFHREVVGSISARKVWNEIIEGAWKTGDPGLIFIDRINKSGGNPVPILGPIEATNPCGEQPLYPYDSCNLGSLFLKYFVVEKNGKNQIDWQNLKNAVRLAVRFLDNVIEINPYPLDEIRKISLSIRRIGLGVGGWADMLIELGIAYDSEEALKLGGRIMELIQTEAVEASHALAKERGFFPLWPVSIYKDGKPRRNSTVTTIAPTGSISIIADASSGIEPLFAVAYQHIVKDKHLDRTLTFFNPKFEEIAQSEGFLTNEIKDKIIQNGVIRNIGEIPERVRNIFATAHEIHYDWHIKMQSVFQKYTENAVSKTINMVNKATLADIENAYLLSWKLGCKGITVFRDGCKSAQVLNLGVGDKQSKEEMIKEPTYARPFVVKGSTYKLNTPVGNAFITINQDDKGEPLEVFINVGKAGSDVTAMAEALGRMISTSFRFRGGLTRIDRVKEIAIQLAGIGGRRSVGFGPNKILSLPDAVAMALSNHFGFKVNGFVNSVNGDNTHEDKSKDGINGNGNVSLKEGSISANGNFKIIEDSFKVNGAAIDAAGATMSAQFPASQAPSKSGDDHTAASAPSTAAPLTSSYLKERYRNLKQLSFDSIELDSKLSGDICPSCGAGSFFYQEGCAKCYSCGYSEC